MFLLPDLHLKGSWLVVSFWYLFDILLILDCNEWFLCDLRDRLPAGLFSVRCPNRNKRRTWSDECFSKRESELCRCVTEQFFLTSWSRVISLSFGSLVSQCQKSNRGINVCFGNRVSKGWKKAGTTHWLKEFEQAHVRPSCRHRTLTDSIGGWPTSHKMSVIIIL